MKIDFSQPITDLDNQPIKDGDKPVTLKTLSTNVLTQAFQDETALAGEKKVERFALALKIHQDTVVDVTAEQVADLKRLIAKAFGPLPVGRAWALLDPPQSASSAGPGKKN